MATLSHLLLLLLLFLLCGIPRVIPFQSDELQQQQQQENGEEDEDEDTTTTNTNVIEQVVTARVRSSASPPDSKIQFEIQHSFGDSDFSPAGSFSARLRNSLLHGGQVLLHHDV
mgnify:CR=1